MLFLVVIAQIVPALDTEGLFLVGVSPFLPPSLLHPFFSFLCLSFSSSLPPFFPCFLFYLFFFFIFGVLLSLLTPHNAPGSPFFFPAQGQYSTTSQEALILFIKKWYLEIKILKLKCSFLQRL